MDLRVEELARRAGVSVDTIRFYQGRGLLPPPQRRGRVAIYGEEHLARLRRIRAWAREGLPLAVIRRLLDRSGDARKAEAPGGPVEDLAEVLAAERVGERTLSRRELAAESGVPEPLIAAAESAGLVTSLRVGGEERFSESDVAMARAALALLAAGLPLDALLRLATDHADNVRAVCDRAVELFDTHVRQAEGEPGAVSRAFRELLPQVTKLVALHFQRTLVSRALERLEDREESEALRQALEAVESGRLALEVKWT